MRHWMLLAGLALVAALVAVYLLWNRGRDQAAASGTSTPVTLTDAERMRIWSQDPKVLVEKGRAIAAKAPPQTQREEWIRWMVGLSEEDRLAYGLYLEGSRVAQPPTAAEQATARVEDLVTDPPLPFPAKILKDYAPLLRVHANQALPPMKFATTRGANGLTTTIWGWNAPNAFTVDWNGRTVTKVSRDTTKVGDSLLGQTPHSILRGHRGQLTYHLPGSAVVRLPWERDSVVYGLALAPQSRYAFGLEKTQDEKYALVVVDIQEQKVVAIVPTPDTRNGFGCGLNLAQGCAYAIDNECRWMMVFDLAAAK